MDILFSFYDKLDMPIQLGPISMQVQVYKTMLLEHIHIE